MRIIFFGTPDFAIPSLQGIYESGHEVAAVVTATDKAKGRGKKLSFTPIKEFALKKGIKIFQPENLRDLSFIESLKEINADVFVVVAFKILPREVYTIPNGGAFNLHGSLLPCYRGAAPIQWAIINGEKETGLTTFFLEDKVDTGNVILQKHISIEDTDNFETLHDRMSLEGAQLVRETLNLISGGNVKTFKQDDLSASPAPKITKELCEIDWKKSAFQIHNLIRGLSPIPGAFFIHDRKRYKIYRSSVSFDKQLNAGEVYHNGNELLVGCGEGTLKIFEIQPEGRNKMTAAEFLRGYSLD